LDVIRGQGTEKPGTLLFGSQASFLAPCMDHISDSVVPLYSFSTSDTNTSMMGKTIVIRIYYDLIGIYFYKFLFKPCGWYGVFK
jgi:hypothetical protein